MTDLYNVISSKDADWNGDFRSCLAHQDTGTLLVQDQSTLLSPTLLKNNNNNISVIIIINFFTAVRSDVNTNGFMEKKLRS